MAPVMPWPRLLQIKVVILEACDRVGSTWAVRYSRLHLHTPKTTSSLPYKPYPKSYPLYPSKDQVWPAIGFM